MKIQILGCGPSVGVPSVGGWWGNCNPDNPKNRRRRSSIFIQENNTDILIDTSPDLREQFIDANISHIDAVLYTHAHADHLHGIDELRVINNIMKSEIPIYGNQETIDEIKSRFGYVFGSIKSEYFYKPVLIPNIIKHKESFKINDVEILPFNQDHGFGGTTLGFRIHNFAYSTDVVKFEEDSFELLKDLDVWIVDCLREKPHETHAHLDLALEWINRLKPKKTILVHLSQMLDYDELKSKLPSSVKPAYDGMIIDV